MERIETGIRMDIHIFVSENEKNGNYASSRLQTRKYKCVIALFTKYKPCE